MLKMLNMLLDIVRVLFIVKTSFNFFVFINALFQQRKVLTYYRNEKKKNNKTKRNTVLYNYIITYTITDLTDSYMK